MAKKSCIRLLNIYWYGKQILAFLVILIFNIKMSYVKTIAKKIYSYSQK